MYPVSCPHALLLPCRDPSPIAEHNLIDRPFPESALDCLPSRAGKPAGSKPAGKSAAAAAPTSVELAPSELARRRDRREKRVFTVDSASTRDIDDALGVERLESGNFQARSDGYA